MKKIFLVFAALLCTTFMWSRETEQGNPPKMGAGGLKSPILEKQPEYPGGLAAFYSFVNSSFKVPKVRKSMTAKIIVSFVVEKDGSMSNFEIVKDPGYGMAAELVWVLKLNTEIWSPGIIDGKPVRASYNLPVTLNIK